jgi:uncharacterized lipoprotein
MSASLARPAFALLLVALTSACARDNNEEQKELAELRVEVEQLTNALGRLEFRVYELENQQPAAAVNAPATPSGDPDTSGSRAAPAPEATAAPEQNDKRFDLAPVE